MTEIAEGPGIAESTGWSQLHAAHRHLAAALAEEGTTMTVDEQLRDAFGPADPAWATRAPAALQRVNAVTNETSRCAGAQRWAWPPRPRSRPSCWYPARRATAADPAAPPTTSAGVAHGLEGHWQSDAVSAADVRSTLREADLGEYADDVLAALPAPPFRIELSVTRSSLDLDLVASGTTERWDEGDPGGS